MRASVPIVLVATAVVVGALYMIMMPGRTYSGPFTPLGQHELEVRDNLREHVFTLAGDIGERNLWRYEALEQAARYIQSALEASGYPISGQVYTVDGRPVRNLEAVREGESRPEEIIIVGAHYDSVHGSPGANDNGTGVAAMIEIARVMADARLPRTVRFVAFVNEEPPFSYTENMGSLVYAQRAAARGENIVGMLSLETIGYYSDEDYSQKYPFPFGLFYPSKGNFIGFVGNVRSRNLVRRSIGSFRKHAQFPSEGVAAPGGLQGIGWSDHWSFWQQGYPALMVTDTALFRYREYHTQSDNADIIHYDQFARVVAGLARVVVDLAGGTVG